MGANHTAALQVVEQLRAAELVADRDEALLIGFVQLAAALDGLEAGSPGYSALWREYREFVEAVRALGAGGADDDTIDFFVSVQTPVRAAVGDAAKSGSGDVRASGRRGRGADGAAVDAVAGAGGSGRRRARS